MCAFFVEGLYAALVLLSTDLSRTADGQLEPEITDEYSDQIFGWNPVPDEIKL